MTMSFCKLNTGEIKFIWSDDVKDKKARVFTMNLSYGYNIKYTTPDIYDFHDIKHLKRR